MSLRKAAFGFAPTSITGCQLWLDGADPAGNGVVPSAGNLSTWTDKSGKSNSPTSSSGTYPTYSPSSKCVTWTGGGTQLTFPTSLHPAVVGTAFTVFFVEQRTTGSENFIIRGTSQGTNLNLLIGHGGVSAATAWRFAFYGNDLDYTGLPSYSASEPAKVSCFMYSKPNRAIYHNGSVSANASDANASDLTSWTGAMIGGDYTWPGYSGNVFEMLIYSTSLTLTQRQQVEGYLAQKFGLTGYLPAGHPGLTTSIYRTDYIKNSAIIRNIAKPIPYFTTFSPRQIPGLGLWLDGADPAGNGVLPASGATVSTWTDKSGNANNGTSGTATFLTDSVGGYINFTGSQTYTITNPNVVVNQYFTIFVVEQLQNYGGGEAAFMGGSGSGNANLHMRYYNNGGNIKFGFFFNDLDTSVTGFTNNSSQPNRIWSFSFTASSRVIYLNGTSIGSDANNTQLSGWAGATIGAMVPYGGQYYTGKMREVMIYSGTMDTTQRQQVESFLAQKWGLTTSLPAGHSHFTKQVGAITTVANTKFRMVGLSRVSQFLPTSITGLQMWMDAADSSAASMTLSGSTVTVWKDKSGLGNNTTARSGTATLTSSAINGKSAISMAGGYFTGPLATANTGTQVHAFAVLTIDSSTGQWARPFALGRPGVDDYNSSTTTFAIIRFNGTQAVGIGRAGQYLSVGIPAYSSAFLVQSSHNGATEYMSVNGNLTVSSASTGQSGNFNITSYGLGVNTNTGDYFALNGYYGEVMYFNVQLSDTNRQKIEGYLAWKWGLQASLPGGHPYASVAP